MSNCIIMSIIPTTLCHLPEYILGSNTRHCSRRFDNQPLSHSTKSVQSGNDIDLQIFVVEFVRIAQDIIMYYLEEPLFTSHTQYILYRLQHRYIIDYQPTKTSFYIVLDISQRIVVIYCTQLPSVVVFRTLLIRRGPVNYVKEPIGRLKRICLFPR